ncbi:hypothetical protein [Bacillus pakistanensis]|uniref:hypothetical protein n=1 Tax=Rossellomorea pakistanensis TaxID=992288 RepID=UPI0019642352|nr:hypothetical protein [Bacillus pakistanensis]
MSTDLFSAALYGKLPLVKMPDLLLEVKVGQDLVSDLSIYRDMTEWENVIIDPNFSFVQRKTHR